VPARYLNLISSPLGVYKVSSKMFIPKIRNKQCGQTSY
jgi:hypothetical protein